MFMRRCAVGRLDRKLQRALLFWILDWYMPLTAHPEAIKPKEKKYPLPGSEPVFTLELLEQLLAGCPLDRDDLAELPAARDLLRSSARPFLELQSGLYSTIQAFLRGRGKSVVGTASAGLHVLLNRGYIPPLLPDPYFLGIRELRHMGPTLPLSYYQFCVAMRLAFDRLGGRNTFENQKGVRGVEVTESGISAMYGGIRENLVEEVIQRGRLHRGSKFVDVGSGIGQVRP